MCLPSPSCVMEVQVCGQVKGLLMGTDQFNTAVHVLEREANNGQSGSQKFLQYRLQWNNVGKKNVLSIKLILIINFYKASL